MEIKEAIIINAPLKKVWNTFTDLTCWINWNSVMTDVNSDRNYLTGGYSVKCNFRPFSFPIIIKIDVEEVIPYERIVWSARKKGLSARHEFIFKNHEKGVMVTSREIFRGLLTKASGFLLPKKKMINLTTTFLKDLKTASEKSCRAF
ncbi:MAG: SRPBCC domain-containing protein [Nitrospirae bacterium]|jgi:hypothetical protein|nr:SRPBCC domain-containing protein [Nitrospirota bacterium]